MPEGEVVMRLLKRHSDEDEVTSNGDDAVETETPAEPDRRVIPRRDTVPATTAETERVPDEPRGRFGDRFRRTVTVPMTVPRRSLRQTMTVPQRRVEQTTTESRWGIAAIVSVATGAALAVIGLIAVMRTGVNETWFQPRTEVLDANHTPLLGAVEVGVGTLFVLLGLAGSRYLVALGGIAGALVATAAAVEPEPLQRELGIESWWAWVLAGAGVLLTLVAVQAPRARRPATVIDVR